MIREAYVDVTVEDSLQEEMWIVYLCFLVSLWMKDLPVYIFTKDSALTFLIIVLNLDLLDLLPPKL